MDRLVDIRRKGKERRENKRAKIEREQRIKRGGWGPDSMDLPKRLLPAPRSEVLL